MCFCIARGVYRSIFSRLATPTIKTRFRGPLLIKPALTRSRVVSIPMMSRFYLVIRIRRVINFFFWNLRCSISRTVLTKSTTPSWRSSWRSTWGCCPIVQAAMPTHARKLEPCRRLEGPPSLSVCTPSVSISGISENKPRGSKELDLIA